MWQSGYNCWLYDGVENRIRRPYGTELPAFAGELVDLISAGNVSRDVVVGAIFLSSVGCVIKLPQWAG
jgi:hypothetical protein